MGRFIFLLSKTTVLDKITFSSSYFFILFQQGVLDNPTFLESSERGIDAFFCNSSNIFLSISSILFNSYYIEYFSKIINIKKIFRNISFFLYISSPIVKSKKLILFFSEFINLYNNKLPGDKFLKL